jgi:AraC family transcriptional regulator
MAASPSLHIYTLMTVEETMIECTEDVRSWFKQSGVEDPLDTCIGPLPRSRASLVRWSSKVVNQSVRTLKPHPDSYRLSLMLAPLEARIWANRHPLWGGMIGAHRFRICPPGEMGAWSQMSSADMVNIFIPLDLVDQLGRLRDDADDTCLTSKLFMHDRMVLDLVYKMLETQAMAGALAREACDGLMTTLVCYLLEHYSRPPTQVEASGLSGMRLRRVLKHIAESSAESLPNAELASLCGMSAAHFSREFRRAVGLPPHQYMVKLRLERARDALLNADDRIVDIAQECGFADASHFSRAFATHFGMSPTSFRYQHRRND